MLFVANKLSNHSFHTIPCNIMLSYGCHSNGKSSTVELLCRFGCNVPWKYFCGDRMKCTEVMTKGLKNRDRLRNKRFGATL